ncbi:MAG TPA: YeeE/YedE thiosulfate transporter family protein [Rhodothermales bacterium]|nr:YeeE/YedE thiosulfate transporter family protein [Rhodothermales bacterium]
MFELISQPWPWYVAGPLIGLVVPSLLLAGGRCFGVSDNYRTICAAVLPARVEFFKYDWREAGTWNLMFAAGIVIGGAIATFVLNDGSDVAISAATAEDLAALGISDFTGLVPSDLFSWSALSSPVGFISLVIGGFLVGFGSRYAGGCTSGHGISGLSDLQLPSLVAVIGFFVGGLFVTYLILPILF